MSLLWKNAVAINGYEITHEPQKSGGVYRAHAYGDTEAKPLAYLRYLHTSPDTVGVDMLHTKKDWRRRGIASMLLDRLREEHPEKKVVTEDVSPVGDRFNRSYTHSRGDGMSVLHPGEWWDGDSDWDGEDDE